MVFRRVTWVTAIAAVIAVACKREDTPPARAPNPYAGPGQQGQAGPPAPGPGPQPQPYPPQGAPPPVATAPGSPPAAPPPATGPQPLGGIPCTSDNDFQCPFARCLGGRCGGCRTDADCKAGAGCFSTPVGPSCMPGGQASAPPAPPPAPPPTTPPPATAPPPVIPPPSGDPHAAARARCVDRINQYRASRGVAAVSPNAERVSCADSSAASDAATQTPHGSFGKCQESAQNECPGWQGSVDTVVDSCAKAMFDEGPGSGPAHGHYNNMMDPGYRSVACGVHTTSDGRVWLVHNFYR